MTTNASPAQLAANRANATHSTGPTTPGGKLLVSLNAVKTGLTGSAVVLPAEDAELYRIHIAGYEREFQPVGIQERELVQSLADIRWRLNRIPALEAALDTNARAVCIARLANLPAAARSSLLTAEVYDMNEKKLRNIHLHENRLARRREKELAELHVLQRERKAREAEAKEKEKEEKQKEREEEAKKTADSAPRIGFEFTNPPAVVETPQFPSKTATSIVSSSEPATDSVANAAA
jgi:hypothetical protein